MDEERQAVPVVVVPTVVDRAVPSVVGNPPNNSNIVTTPNNPSTTSTALPAKPLSKWEWRASVLVCAIDLMSTVLGFQASLQKTSCCGNENVVGDLRWLTFGVSIVYAALLVTEIGMIVFKSQVFLTVFNPFLRYCLTSWMLYTAGLTEALVTMTLETIAFGLDAFTLCQIWTERRWVMLVVQGINLVFGCVVIYYFANALAEGGVCLVESPENGYWIFAFGDGTCNVCADTGLPANNTFDPCLDEPDRSSPGEYCGDEYLQFCFQEF